MDKDNKNNTAPLSFSGTEAENLLRNVLRYFEKAGLDPYVTAEWKKGIFKLFGVETINLPDLDGQSYILSSNHISDFDAVILGLLHPNIRIIAKMGWASNKKLMDFLGLHYDIVGIYRDFEIEKLDGVAKEAAKKHNYRVTIEALKYLKDDEEPRHLLIFPQGTISDVNRNSKERVNPGFAKIAFAAKGKVVNIFTEYPDMGGGGSTRVVCGEPYEVKERNFDYRQPWLEGVISLQNKLDNVREPILSDRHLNNNKPGDPFF